MKKVSIFKIRRSVYKVLIHSFLISLSILALFPIYFLVTSSLKSREVFLYNRFGIPLSIDFGNYIQAFKTGDNFIRWFFNSTIITTASVTISLICTVLAAFAFVFLKFKGKNVLFNITVSLMVFPPVAILIPLFLFMNKMHLINSYFGIIIIYVGLILPFSVYLMSSFFSTIPKEILEASLMDGCRLKDIIIRILLPLSFPAIITMIVVNTLFIWNELVIAMVFLQSNESRTLMAGLMSFKSRYNVDLPVIMAGLTVISIPIILLYFFGSRYFIKGLSSGSLKG